VLNDLMQISVGLDQGHKMNGISSATRIRNTQQEQEQIEQLQLGFGKQQEGTKPYITQIPKGLE
jgi:hypothetical protein